MSLTKKALTLVFLAALFVGAYHARFKDLPSGVSVRGGIESVPAGSVSFLSDETYVDAEGFRRTDQKIFDEVFRMVDGAREYILVDMFLYNDFQGEAKEMTRALSSELTDVLIAKKIAFPDVSITVITDPINTVYGGVRSDQFERLSQAGVNVVFTDLEKLRDSNPAYSSFWRMFVRWFGNDDTKGFLVHPFQYNGQGVTARSYFSLLNFKANHRKLVITDNGAGKMVTLVMSANPHDGSSAHGNSAVVVEDRLWREVLVSERAVGALSSVIVPEYVGEVVDETGDVSVQLLTEGKIRESLLEMIDTTQAGDTIDMAMFYLSERDIIKALKEADHRGVSVRLILDPNKDAFGHQKNGVPNRPVADELMEDTIGHTQIRWCDTHGEQCHSKMVLIRTEGVDALLIGSANLTRRNVGDLNLETDVLVKGGGVPAIVDARAYFERLWGNTGGRVYTAPYETYAEDSFIKTALYRFMEATGLSTF